MKTKMNINQLAKMSFATLTLFALSAVSTVKASNTDVEDASERLENMSIKIEESMKFKAPVVSEDIEAYETAAAFERLENLNLSVGELMRYKALPVDESNDTELSASTDCLGA